ncbi:unnamed protein product [Caenorhabditis nigoni]
MKFPASEFFLRNGVYLEAYIGRVGRAVSRASWEISRDAVESRAEQGRGNDQYFNPPKPDDWVVFTAHARQTISGVHELEYKALVKRGGETVKLAVGNSCVWIAPPSPPQTASAPASEQQQPGPSGDAGSAPPTKEQLRKEEKTRSMARKQAEQGTSAIPGTAPPNTATQLTRPAPATTPANPTTRPAANPSGKGPDLPTMPQRAQPTVPAVQTVSSAPPPPPSAAVGPIRPSQRQLRDLRKARNIERKEAEQARSSSTIPVTAQSTTVPGAPTMAATNSTRAAPRSTPAAPRPPQRVSKIHSILDWRYHRNLESSVLQQYNETKMSFMDEIPQRFMLCGVKNMDDLAKLMLAKRFVPKNIAQSAMFFKTPLTVFYFDTDNEYDQQQVFHKDNISEGKFFFARAMPLKTILRTTLIATRILDHRVRESQRSETVDDNKELEFAIQYPEGMKIRKILDPWGLMILQGLTESIGGY